MFLYRVSLFRGNTNEEFFWLKLTMIIKVYNFGFIFLNFSFLLYGLLHKKNSKTILPDRELNPGLPRDRRGYSPLYYRGCLRSLVLSVYL